jgi:regulator of cell morphogenesis and NO signaling
MTAVIPPLEPQWSTQTMTTTSTLAELATTHPAASRVFQRFGLDYCCGGRRPLADVCESKGLDPDTILSAIADEEARVDLPRWDRAPIPELITFIVERYHQALRNELPALIAQAARVENRHGDKPGCPHGLRDLLAAMHVDVLAHLEKEERVLFPMILDGYGARVGGPVRVLEAEHDGHGANLERIRQLTNNLTPPAHACPTWRALYLRLDALERELMDHVHLENNVLFPRALEGQV